jgi:hypothetical protein
VLFYGEWSGIQGYAHDAPVRDVSRRSTTAGEGEKLRHNAGDRNPRISEEELTKVSTYQFQVKL